MTKDAQPRANYREVAEALRGSTILVTGAAGFVGTALLYRLLEDPAFCNVIRRVVAIIRGDTVEASIARLPSSLQAFTRSDPSQPSEASKLVVLNGDCGYTTLGLTSEQAEIASEADIVLHIAGDTKFKLSVPEALVAITDLAYATARFSLTSPKVKTHLHISTSYVGWFLESGSAVSEQLYQDDISPNVSDYELQVNSYLHAKVLGESCVNGLFSPQAGLPLHGKSARIIRLAGIGAALQFPYPGWGSGTPSSPLSALIATGPIGQEYLDTPVDIVPVDITANQILGLAAAAHRTQSLSADSLAHPQNPRNPLNCHRAQLPCYTISGGVPSSAQLRMANLNVTEAKISKPFIPKDIFLELYGPFLSKNIEFVTSHTHKVLGIPPFNPASSSEPKMGDGLRDLSSSKGMPSSAHDQTSGLQAKEDEQICSFDPPIKCGTLDIDLARTLEKLWGTLSGPNAPGWMGYLKCASAEMDTNSAGLTYENFMD